MMKECKIYPYCDSNCKQCPYAEGIAAFAVSYAEAVQRIIPILGELVSNIVPALTNYAQRFSRIYGEAISYYPNKRVVWLALYHPKARIRRKNMNRILKSMRKGGGSDE